MFQRFGRPLVLPLAVLLAAIYAVATLHGPHGIRALIEKNREIRQLEERNSAAALDNQRRREHVERLKDDASEQDMEIRKGLKLQRPGETTFFLPDTPKDAVPPTSAQP